jgi:hypothetical protein
MAPIRAECRCDRRLSTFGGHLRPPLRGVALGIPRLDPSDIVQLKGRL